MASPSSGVHPSYTAGTGGSCNGSRCHRRPAAGSGLSPQREAAAARFSVLSKRRYTFWGDFQLESAVVDISVCCMEELRSSQRPGWGTTSKANDRITTVTTQWQRRCTRFARQPHTVRPVSCRQDGASALTRTCACRRCDSRSWFAQTRVPGAALLLTVAEFLAWMPPHQALATTLCATAAAGTVTSEEMCAEGVDASLQTRRLAGCGSGSGVAPWWRRHACRCSRGFCVVGLLQFAVAAHGWRLGRTQGIRTPCRCAGAVMICHPLERYGCASARRGAQA